MKKFIIMLVLISITASTIFISYAQEQEDNVAARIYVSQSGNDNNNGKENSPFKTFDKAKTEAAKLAKTKKGTIEVIIREGRYKLDNTIEFFRDNSGTESSPIVFKGCDGEEVKITNASPLDSADFKLIEDEEILSRLPEEAKGKVYYIDLKALGIKDYGSVEKKKYGKNVEKGFELYFNHEALNTARWPNGKFALTGQVTKNDNTGVGFLCENERYKNWGLAKEALVYGFWDNGYGDDALSVSSINIETGEINSPDKPYFGFKSDRKYYIYNLLEEIDIPGEYYLDRTNGMLYVYPPEDIYNADIEYTNQNNNFIKMNNASYITVENILFEGSCGSAVSFSYCKYCSIKNCRIMNIAGNAMSVVGGNDCKISGCEIYRIGGGGINSYCGDRQSLTSGNFIVENNHIHKFAQYAKTYSPAVNALFVGCTVRNNVIHDAPHCAIMYGGNNNTIEYNEIYDVVKETDDAGAIYGGRDFTTRGNKICNNYIHDVTGPGAQAVGIYLDDMVAGINVSNNILRNVTQPIGVGGGQDNIVKNNLILDGTANTKQSLYYDSRGLSEWAGGPYRKDPENFPMIVALKSMPYQGEIWSKAYPELVHILDSDPMVPMRAVITGNIVSNHGEIAIADAVVENGTVENNYFTDKKIEIDTDEKNKISFPDEDIFKEFPEYQPWDVSKIGLNDDYQFELPKKFVPEVKEVITNANVNPPAVDMKPIIDDSESWDSSVIKVKNENGNLLLYGNGTTGYLPQKYKDGKFSFKLALSSDSSWVGFMIRSTKTNVVPWSDGGCYLFVVKKDTFELQRWNAGANKMIRTLESKNYAGDNNFANVEIEIANINDEAVSLIFRYNGAQVFNYIDIDEFAIYKENYFSVFTSGKDDSAISLGEYDENLQTSVAINPYGEGAQTIEQTKYKVKINDKFVRFNTEPFMDNGTVYVPYQGLFEHLGYETDCVKGSNTVVVFNESDKIIFKADNENYVFKKEILRTSLPPKLSDGKIFVSARMVADILGFDISWDNITKTVTMQKKNVN